MPATPPGHSFEDSAAFLGVMAVSDEPQELAVPGVETTFLVSATLDARTVTVE
jgi:hypothetical protein